MQFTITNCFPKSHTLTMRLFYSDAKYFQRKTFVFVIIRVRKKKRNQKHNLKYVFIIFNQI